jgi:hypothetical protein
MLYDYLNSVIIGVAVFSIPYQRMELGRKY